MTTAAGLLMLLTAAALCVWAIAADEGIVGSERLTYRADKRVLAGALSLAGIAVVLISVG